MAAKPEKSKKTRGEILAAAEEAGEARPELDLPPVDFGRHLVDLLYRVGPSTAGEVITFQELVAFRSSTGIAMNSWEATTLRAMSGAYLGELSAATDPRRPSPTGVIRRAAAAAVMNMINAMMSQYEEAPAEDASPDPSEARPSQKRSAPTRAAPASRGRVRSPGRSPPK